MNEKKARKNASKINKVDALKLHHAGYSYASIGKYYGVKRQYIWRILRPFLVGVKSTRGAKITKKEADLILVRDIS